MANLTIVIPCCEKDEIVEKSMQDNYKILVKYPLVIIDKEGGDKFIQFEQQGNYDIHYFEQNTSWWFARRFGLEYVKTEYVLCLDVDTVLPPQYIEKAIELLENNSNIGVVALFYELSPQEHLAFGTSIWRTEYLKEIYDWRMSYPPTDSRICECKYMWDKVLKNGKKVETLPMKAIHIGKCQPITSTKS